VEIVNAHLKRIEAMRPKLNAFVHVDADGARAASSWRRRRGTQRSSAGTLHGVPITIKSCIDVAGWTCPAGSLLRKDYVSPSDAPLVARLREAGAILLGNTNTPEFLMAYETIIWLAARRATLGLVAQRGRFEWRRSSGDCVRCSAGGVAATAEAPSECRAFCGIAD